MPWIIAGFVVIAACLVWLAWELRHPFEELPRIHEDEDTIDYVNRHVA